MSHLASRLVAQWLRDESYGLDAIAANVPLLADDDAPESVTVYDDLTTDWLAQGQLPSEDAADDTITYPCALVVNGAGRFADGLGWSTADGRLTDGSISVVVQLVVRDPDGEAARGHRTLMYLLRAARNALLSLSYPTTESVAARTDDTLGIQLQPHTSIEQGRAVVPMGDDLLSGSLVVTFPVTETTVLR